MSTKIFEWMPEFSVNVALIDEQHKKFVDMLNKVFEATTSLTSSDEHLLELLGQLGEQAKVHFATEEKYFDQFHYEFTEEHKLQHKKILDSVAKFMSEKHASYREAGRELLVFLEDWLVDHLAYWDKKYTQCFNEHGLV